MSLLEFILPLVLLVIVCIPLMIKKGTVKSRMITHICLFFGAFGLVLLLGGTVMAEDVVSDPFQGSLAQGMAYLSAALAVSSSALGAGFAVAKAAPAAIGAISENEENFGKAMIFVALAEGVAIYGLLIAILIINKL